MLIEKPLKRPRRLRTGEAIRSMVRETHLHPDDFIYPIFVTGSKDKAEPIDSMPGIYRYSVDRAVQEAGRAYELDIPAILLFGIPAYKDSTGSSASADDEAVQRAVKAVKDRYPELAVITDVCLCEYTDHGHCGVVGEGKVLNDDTLSLLAEVALSHARSGADIVAPSDMMDGRVAAIRSALDEHNYKDIAIMSYAAKYASAFYGPFRDAAGSSPQFGCRRSYQMDPANAREALREVKLDIDEGADMVIVKPALAYLDITRTVRETMNIPLVTYNVSGEYAMVKAAAAQGWLDEEKVMQELLLSMKRAGADMIITYHALTAARLLQQ